MIPLEHGHIVKNSILSMAGALSEWQKLKLASSRQEEILKPVQVTGDHFSTEAIVRIVFEPTDATASYYRIKASIVLPDDIVHPFSQMELELLAKGFLKESL